MINYVENKSRSRCTVYVDDGPVSVSAIRKGCVNEHIAKAWLLKLGYEVFSNISPEGPADLVAVKFDSQETMYVDVKSQSFSFDGEDSSIYRERHEKYGIRYLVVDDDGRCDFATPPKQRDTHSFARSIIGLLPEIRIRKRPESNDNRVAIRSIGGLIIQIPETSSYIRSLEQLHGKLPNGKDVVCPETGEFSVAYSTPGCSLHQAQCAMRAAYRLEVSEKPTTAPNWLCALAARVSR